jgi:hypothetical protein
MFAQSNIITWWPHEIYILLRFPFYDNIEIGHPNCIWSEFMNLSRDFMRKRFCILPATNLVTVENFEVMSDNIKLVGICTGENYTQE